MLTQHFIHLQPSICAYSTMKPMPLSSRNGSVNTPLFEHPAKPRPTIAVLLHRVHSTPNPTHGRRLRNLDTDTPERLQSSVEYVVKSHYALQGFHEYSANSGLQGKAHRQIHNSNRIIRRTMLRLEWWTNQCMDDRTGRKPLICRQETLFVSRCYITSVRQ